MIEYYVLIVVASDASVAVLHFLDVGIRVGSGNAAHG